MTAHIHADLMLQYAQDAMTSPEPWKFWQHRNDVHDWEDCIYSPVWSASYNYRRKEDRITINGLKLKYPCSTDVECKYFLNMNTLVISDFRDGINCLGFESYNAAVRWQHAISVSMGA
jgi:hypothetical protein